MNHLEKIFAGEVIYNNVIGDYDITVTERLLIVSKDTDEGRDEQEFELADINEIYHERLTLSEYMGTVLTEEEDEEDDSEILLLRLTLEDNDDLDIVFELQTSDSTQDISEAEDELMVLSHIVDDQILYV